jgi:hypothetical protein
MTAPGRDTLWAALVASGLATGEVPACSPERSPWYVRAMLGVAAWIGALFLFGFVGAMFAFVLESAFASIAAGVLVCTGAAMLLRWHPEATFAAQFGFAVSLAGQGLICNGLAQWFGTRLWPTALLMAGVQATLFFLVPNFGHRVWTIATAVLAAALALGDLRLHTLTPALVTAASAWLWIREFDHGAKAALVRAAGYGLALASLPVIAMHGEWLTREVLRQGGGGPLGGALGVWLGAALSAAALVWAAALLLQREGVSATSGPGATALTGAAILGVASFTAPGVGPAVAILVLGYANANRVLTGLGVIGLLGYLAHYYYVLHATLLEKSTLLACTGLALLAAHVALHRWWPARSGAAPRA